MKRWLVCMATLGAIALVARPATAELFMGFTVGVAKAPPAPVFRYASPPEMVRASDAMVFVIRQPDPRYAGDLFRFGQYWFAYTGGFWYRARDCKGPYSVIDVRNVPRAVLYVPRKHWKHHPKGPATVTGKPKPSVKSAAHQPQVVSVRPYPPGVPPAKPYVKPAPKPETKGNAKVKDATESKPESKQSKKNGKAAVKTSTTKSKTAVAKSSKSSP